MRISDWSSDVCSSDLCLYRRFQSDIGPQFVARRQSQVDVQLFVAARQGQQVIAAGYGVFDTGQGIATDLLVYQGIAVQHIEVQARQVWRKDARSEEHTSELQSLMRISYAVFTLKKKRR